LVYLVAQCVDMEMNGHAAFDVDKFAVLRSVCLDKDKFLITVKTRSITGVH